MSCKKGFTLIEIIVCLIIIGVLAAIALPNYFTMLQQGSSSAAQNNLKVIYTAEQAYYFNNGSYCLASCDNLADINTNLALNISDSNNTYACQFNAGPNCVAENQPTTYMWSLYLNEKIALSGQPTGANPYCSYGTC